MQPITKYKSTKIFLPMKRLLLLLFSLLPINMFAQTITRLESVQSLYIEVYKDNIKIGSATGFITKSKTQYYLVTNYHVVTNKKAANNKWIDSTKQVSPNKVVIFHNAKKLGDYIIKTEPLLDRSGKPLWYQDTIKSEIVDVIELPLKNTADIQIYPVNYSSSPLMMY